MLVDQRRACYQLVLALLAARHATNNMPLDVARFIELRYVARMLNDSPPCMREPVSVRTRGCARTSVRDNRAVQGRGGGAEEFGGRGAHMIPRLIREHSVQSLVEIGVCTGMSTVNVLAQFPTTPEVLPG